MTSRHHPMVVVLVGIIATAIAGLPAQATDSNVVRYARFEVDDKVSYGIVEGDRLRRLSGDLFGSWSKTDTTYALSEVKLLAPTAPSKVLAVALNYKSHAGTQPTSSKPEIFFKVPTTLVPHGGDIVLPRGSNDVHYEGELVIVIGKKAKDVPENKALEYVLGVTCGNDVSARDWQKQDRQWWRAKGADTFGPCGPFIASGLNYDDLRLELRVNGEVKQQERTSQMIHSVSSIVSWISRHVTLVPGDLIFTGTPGQTSAIKAGDVVEVEIEGVGVLRNNVVLAPLPGR